MIFYLRPSRNPLPPIEAQYPCALLVRDGWNDYGFTATFNIKLFPTPKKHVVEGFVKILRRRRNRNNILEPVFRTDLPEEFESLDADTCSMGGDLSYYQKLKKAGPEIYLPFLEQLRDIVYDKTIGRDFELVPGFRESLLRSSEANKAYAEGARIFGRKTRSKLFSFSFICNLRGATDPHRVDFDFRTHRTGLNRTTVLIGRNGTGKTQFLAAFARAMSGERKADGAFEPRRPSFSRVIAVSFSAFDSFTRPLPNSTKFGYIYCGIRAERRGPSSPRDTPLLNHRQIRVRLERSLGQVAEQDRLPKWSEILSILLERKVPIMSPAFSGTEAMDIYRHLSSGQRMLMAAFTGIVAHIRPESIVLFDEPELHLHPDIFAALMRALTLLLKEFDSYAILATHAPLLLQETMARQVRVFRRQGNSPIIAPLGIECFGENLTTITREVFEGADVGTTFREVLERLQTHYTAQQIEEMFPLGLPLQADAFLQTNRSGR